MTNARGDVGRLDRERSLSFLVRWPGALSLALLLGIGAGCVSTSPVSADRTADESTTTTAAQAELRAKNRSNADDSQTDALGAVNAKDRLIGAESADWMLSPASGFEAWGERVLDNLESTEDSKLGLAIGQSESGPALVVDRRLDANPDAVVFRIESVLRFGPGVGSDEIAWERCSVGGIAAHDVVAVLHVDETQREALRDCSATTKVKAAWRASADGFKPINDEGVRCPVASCEPATSEIGGVVGGFGTVPLDAAAD